MFIPAATILFVQNLERLIDSGQGKSLRGRQNQKN